MATKSIKIFAVGRMKLGITTDQIEAHLREDAKYTWELYKAGLIYENYEFANLSGRVIVLDCEDMAEAKKIMDNFPLVRAGLIEFEFIPVSPFTALEILFADK